MNYAAGTFCQGNNFPALCAESCQYQTSSPIIMVDHCRKQNQQKILKTAYIT